uniref:Hexosyltransferase n=1 Tax=Mesocestoides corti TaxID=53468 RepID=A0A5K3FR39_MESCO
MSGDKDKDKASQSCDTPLDLPPFSQVDVVGWFNAVEQRFQLHNITCQKTMYCLVTPLLPPLVASSVADLIDEAPAENPYDTLKAAIIAKWTASSELALVPYQPPRAEVGNVKPSQLFWQLLHGVGQNTAQKLALRRSWAQHLPMDMRDGVQLAADANMTLEKLLNIVDNIHHWLATANKPKWALCRSQGQVGSLCDRLDGLSLKDTSMPHSLRRWRCRVLSNSKAICQSRSNNDGSGNCRFRFSSGSRFCRPSCRHPHVSEQPGYTSDSETEDDQPS